MLKTKKRNFADDWLIFVYLKESNQSTFIICGKIEFIQFGFVAICPFVFGFNKAFTGPDFLTVNK